MKYHSIPFQLQRKTSVSKEIRKSYLNINLLHFDNYISRKKLIDAPYIKKFKLQQNLEAEKFQPFFRRLFLI